MSKYRIPIEFKEGWIQYISLSSELKNEFFKLLDKAPIGLSKLELTNYLAGKIKIETVNLNNIAKSLFTLFEAKSQSDIGLKDFVTEIIKALDVAKINVSQDLEKSLIELLSIKGSINLTLKAILLATDRQNILSDTRILTDIRPVFGNEDESEKIKASIVTHNLKIEYNEDNLTKFIYFALDRNDLKNLKEDIERAERKEENIRKAFDSNNLFIELK